MNDSDNVENIFLQLKANFPNYIEPQINLLAIYANEKKDVQAKELLRNISNKSINKSVPNKVIYDNIKNYYHFK